MSDSFSLVGGPGRARTLPWLAAALVLALWSIPAGETRAQPAQPEPLKAGMPAPELEKGVAWLGVDRPLSLKELRGKFVILDFWTLC